MIPNRSFTGMLYINLYHSDYPPPYILVNKNVYQYKPELYF